MDALLRDIRYAHRSWRRAPGPIVAALAALALGIGANTAIFSIVAGVLLRPLPYQNPERLVMVWQDMRGRGGPARDWTSPGLFVEWRQRGNMFEELAAVRGWMPNLTGIDEPERLRGAAVSAAYFAALGVPAAVGRTFSEDDDRPGGGPMAIISDALFTRLFSRDRGIVGRTILLDGQATTVAGIMPPGFDPPIIPADIWSPIRIDPSRAPRGMIVLRVIGKLKPGITLAQAQAGMATIATQLEQEDAEWERARVAVIPLHEDLVGDVRAMLLVLALAVALVLCMACANVMSLLLARAADRTREITIRAALGAGRGQIVRQLLTESALLSACGGVAGLMLAWWGVRALIAVAPSSAPRLHEVRMDGLVLAFTAGVTIGTAAISGLAPALATARAGLNAGLRDGGREATGSSKVRAVLVVAEIAIALVLVVGAALLVRTLVALQRVDMGFNGERVLTASIAPPRGQYRDPASLRQLYQRLLDRAAAIPGVRSAAVTNVLPLSGADMDLAFRIQGRAPAATAGDQPTAWTRVVSASYVSTMGMRLLQGRDLTRLDTDTAPGAVLVNETLARRYWAGRSPLGAKLNLNDLEATVVGIVADVRHRGPSVPPEAEMYIPFTQFNNRQGAIVLRTVDDPARATAALRAAMRDVDPSLPLANVTTMRTLMDRSVAQPRFLAALLTGFAGLAAVLALVGVYGLLSFSVSRRVRELGVRMALGAGRWRVMRLVLGQSAALVAAGLVAGVALAIALSRLLRTLLFGVRPGDPATIVAMACAIAVAAILASVPPALRASRIDPVVALREE
ncbi:MAG TPA: ABC transporter permease [Vicinamibacterales bacterium]|nr:ABC transporter permease [Vicinamibacterales bacterium]